MKNLLILVLLLIIAGCSPEAKIRKAERKMARLVKKHPELVKSDTTWKDTMVAAPAIKDSTEFITAIDTAAVDSLTNHFTGKVDSLILDSLNQGFKVILNKSGDIDTTVVSNKTKFHFKRRGTITKINIEVEPEPVKIKYPAVVKTVKPVAPLKIHERILMHISKKVGIVGMGLLFIILVYILYRIIKYLL